METQGIVEAVKHDGTGLKLGTGVWYSSFHNKVNCKKGDEVKITYTDNSKDGRVYHNFDNVEVIKSAPQKTEKSEGKSVGMLVSYAKDLVTTKMAITKDLNVPEAMKIAAESVGNAYNIIKRITEEEPKKENGELPQD